MTVENKELQAAAHDLLDNGDTLTVEYVKRLMGLAKQLKLKYKDPQVLTLLATIHAGMINSSLQGNLNDAPQEYEVED